MIPEREGEYAGRFENFIKRALGREATALEYSRSAGGYINPLTEAAWNAYLALAQEHDNLIEKTRDPKEASDLREFEDEYQRAFGPTPPGYFDKNIIVGKNIYANTAAHEAYRGWLAARNAQPKPGPVTIMRRAVLIDRAKDLLQDILALNSKENL